MAANPTTYFLGVARDRGHTLSGVVTGNDANVGYYISALPNPLFAGDSFELVVDHYEHYASSGAAKKVSDFGAAATCALYIIWANVADATPTLLATGAITEATVAAGYNRATYQVVKDAISTDWAGTTAVWIYEQISYNDGSDRQETMYAQINIIDRNGTSAASIVGSSIANNLFITPPVTIDATATGQTTNYTVPTGKNFVALRWRRRIRAITTPGTPESVQLGSSTVNDQLLAATALTGTVANAIATVEFDPSDGTNVFTAGELLQTGVTTGSTAAAQTIDAWYEGLLLDAP